MKKRVTLLSVAFLFCSMAAVPICSVLAEETQAEMKMPETQESQISVAAQMRGNEPYIDATITMVQPVNHSTQATVMLQDVSGNIINTCVYTMSSGQRRFTAWFDLSGQKTNDYKISVKVHDKDVVFNGNSALVHFDSKVKKAPMTSQNNQVKTKKSTETSTVDRQPSLSNTVTASETQSRPTKQASHQTVPKTVSSKVMTTTKTDDTKMLTDRDGENNVSKKGFPWLLSGSVALLVLGLFFIIQKVAHRK
ncbi:hypothetical protein ACVR0P_08305 [Streptococcus castoreus]|uniref:hypothetical protein n=1 Tax=Streptococcus castoreus TaxID=254786 RepID=UPI0004203517|nr:hypothetical protein [Streptococcus castoreus]